MANSYTGFLLNLAAAVDEAQRSRVAPNMLLKTIKNDLRPTPAARFASIQVNIPASTFSIQNLTTGSLNLSDVSAAPVSVTLDKHQALGFPLPDYDTVRMIDPAGARDLFVDEAIKRLLETINADVAALITAGNFAQVIAGAGEDSISFDEFTQMWNTLVGAKVPVQDEDNMFLVMHNNVYRRVLGDNAFAQASQVGESIASAIRRTGVLGRALGVNLLYDLNMPVSSGVYTSLMFHRSAMCLAARPMETENALGVEQITAFYDGIPIRISIGYDQLSFSKRITFDCLYGVKVIRANHGVRHTSI